MKKPITLYSLGLAAAACFITPALFALPGDWEEPAEGYTVSYDPAGGANPYFASPGWGGDPFRGEYYLPENSFVTTDSLTGEPVLYMTPADPANWESYALLDSGGAGAVDDRITVDFRFRLLNPEFTTNEGETAGWQFRMAVWRPDALGDGSRRFMVTFSTDTVSFLGGASAEYDIGTDWHDARLTIDVSAPVAYLYLDGSSTPILAGSGFAQSQAERNWVMFGHQGTDVGGELNLAYFNFTNDEIAIEPVYSQDPELTVETALQLSFETEEDNFYQLQGLNEASEWMAVGGQVAGTGEIQTELLSLMETTEYQVVGGPAGWQDPENGFTVAYDASGGWTPDLSEPAWDAAIFGHDYTEDQAQLVVDEITGETVLFLEDPDSNNPQPNYALNHTGGLGTADDLVTLDIRFRLLDGEHTGEHFNFGVWRPSVEEGKVQRYTFFIYLDSVRMLSGATAEYEFGTGWNTVRVTIDSANQVGNLYVNGSGVPLLGEQSGRIENATALSGLGDRNAVYFGHQGAGSFGAFHLAHVRFTNDELAAEGIPLEPVATDRSDAMELFFTGLAGKSYQFRQSPDLVSWELIDEPFFRGTVDPLRTLIAVDEATEREFFQYVDVTEGAGGSF